MKLLLFLFSIGWLASAGAGEVRYLANSGDDAADGKTPATAWRTIEKLNAFLPAGGTALLKRGDTFYGGISLPAGLDAEHPTVLAAYGEGPKPVVSCLKTIKRDEKIWDAYRHLEFCVWKVDLMNPSNFTGVVSKRCNPGFLLVDGEIKPWRKFDYSDVNMQWDFAEKDGYLYVHSTNNPARLAKEIRVAEKVDAIFLRPHVRIKDISIFGTGAHGMQGGWNEPLADIRISDCDLNYIGGSELLGYSEEIRVRYGNGIELGSGCDGATVERCNFSNIYDVAFTMQGFPRQGGGWKDVVVRDCTMTDCTQGFEIWTDNSPKGVGYERCVFTGNRTKRVGGGWGSVVRPNRHSATPLLVYGVDTDTVDITVSGNVFEDAPLGVLYKSGGISALPKGYIIKDNIVK